MCTSFLALRVIGFGLSAASTQLYLNGEHGAPMKIRREVSAYVALTAIMLGVMKDLLIFLTLVSLGSCISTAKNGSPVRTKVKRYFHYIAYGVGLALGCLWLSVFALRCKLRDMGSTGTLKKNALGTKSNAIMFSVILIIFLLSVVITALALATRVRLNKSTSKQLYKSVSPPSSS